MLLELNPIVRLFKTKVPFFTPDKLVWRLIQRTTQTYEDSLDAKRSIIHFKNASKVLFAFCIIWLGVGQTTKLRDEKVSFCVIKLT